MLQKETNDEKPKGKFTTNQKVALATLATADFLCFCSMSIMAPFYPKESSAKGMSETMSGFVFSFYSLVIFISSPIYGELIPKVGVKTCFVVGIIVSGICSILFGTLNYIEDYTTFTALSFTIRGIEALGSSSYCTASYVLVSNIFPDHAGFVRGVLEIFVGLGLSAGPAFGGLLFSLGGFGLPFYVVGLIILSLAPLIKCFKQNEGSTKQVGKSVSLTSVLKVPSVTLALIIIVVVSITWSFLDPTLEPHLRKYNLTSYNIGLIFLLLSGTYGVFSPLAGWLGDKMDNFWLLMVGGMFFSGVSLLFMGPSRLVYFISESIWWKIGALSILGICVAAALLPTYRAVLDGAIVEAGHEDNLAIQGLVAGLWASMYSLGEVIGPITGGALLDHFGFPVTVEVVASMNILTSIITLAYFFHRKRVIQDKSSMEKPNEPKENFAYVDTENFSINISACEKSDECIFNNRIS